MAKQTEQDNLQQMNALLANIKGGKFSPVYILMGEEPYYSDIIIEAILANVLEPSERDFNQTVVYAQDTTTADIVQACRRFPMFAPTVQLRCVTASLRVMLRALASFSLNICPLLTPSLVRLIPFPLRRLWQHSASVRII